MRCCQFLHGKAKGLNGAEDNLQCACSAPVSKTKRLATTAQNGKQPDTEPNNPTRADTNGREKHGGDWVWRQQRLSINRDNPHLEQSISVNQQSQQKT